MLKYYKILYFSIIGQPSILQSPPLPHEHRYGLAQMPSAFSMIGRRPNLHHHDFTTSLTHDPLMTTSPRIQRSPTPATSGSWWRQPSISAHPQNMNNTDIFGNPLLWLPHEQEHMRPHENLTYHNSAQAYRNFDFLNGSSPGSYYASTPRFFPEPTHSLHSMPTLGKDRPLSWEDRLGGHGLMLDVSGNGFSPWQDMHQQKIVDRQQKQMQESVEKERASVGLPNNRSSNFTDNNSIKGIKPSNKYLENHNSGPPTISSDSRLKVPVIPPSESCLNVPVISNDSRQNVPGMTNNSRLNLLGIPNSSHLKVPVMSNEPHLKIPSISNESSFNIPSLTSEPKLDIPSITNETQLNDASLSDDSRHGITSSSGDSRHGITSIIGDSRLDVPVVTTESRLNTPPLMSKEPQHNLPPLSSESRQNIPLMTSESRQNMPLMTSESRQNQPQSQLHVLSESRQNLSENQSRLLYSSADTSISVGNTRRSQPERTAQHVPSSIVHGRVVSPSKPDLPVNCDQYKQDATDQYKRDTVINSLESSSSNAPPIFSLPALIKSVPAPPIKSGKQSSGLPSPVKLHPARPTGGKPRLLERFRAPTVPRPGGDSSSDDGSSDGDDEDGESGSDSDSDDDGISEDGNDDDDDDDEVEEKVKKQPGQSHIQQLQKPQQSQQSKPPQPLGQQVLFIFV